MRDLTPTQVGKWSDAKLAEAIRETHARMMHFGVDRWECLPPWEARRALIIRNEYILRTCQLEFDYGSVSS